MAHFSIISSQTGSVIFEGAPRYVGAYLKPGYLEFQEIGSPVAIDWHVGDYVAYSRTGKTYRLYRTPQTVEQGQTLRYGAAFLYENVQFYDDSKQVELCPFTDLVPGDNTIHFSTQNIVSFFGKPLNVAERLQACLEAQHGVGTWEVRIVTTSDADLLELLDTEAEFSVSGANCQQVLEKVYETWSGLGWVHTVEQGVNVITIGASNVRTAANTTAPFTYGDGLVRVERSIANADEIGTRLFAYGSMKNMDATYYRGLDIKDAESVDIEHLMIPLANWGITDGKPDARKAYIENAAAISALGLIPKTAYFDGTGDLPDIHPTIERMTIGEVYDAGGAGYIPSLSKWSRSQRVDELVSASNPEDHGTTAEQGQRFTESIDGTLPAHTENFLENDSFDCHIFTATTTHAGLLSLRFGQNAQVFTLTSDWTPTFQLYFNVNIGGAHRQVPLEVKQTGLRSFALTLPESINITGATAGRLDVSINGWISRAETDPQGSEGDFVVDPSTTISGGIEYEIVKEFSVTIPQIGFDIEKYAALGNGKTISMRTGMCAGRDFEIKDATYVSATDSWRLALYRSIDDDLNIMFPNADYEIAAGDQYVLLDIAMPEMYVTVASQRLLEAAQRLLADISVERPFYSPKIDAKVVINENRVLREGMWMDLTFESTREYVLVDSITIDEDGSNIPTYEVALRQYKGIDWTESIGSSGSRSSVSVNENEQEANGTVTSVGMTVPEGMTVDGSPIQSAGIFRLGLKPGFVIPTTEQLASYFQLNGSLATLVELRSDYSYLGPSGGLFFSGATLTGTPVPDLYVDTVNGQRVLRSPLPLITGGDQIVIDGTPGGGGGGGGATFLSDLEDVSIVGTIANGQYLVFDNTLAGGGKWTNKTLGLASSAANGLMSYSDFNKLAGIAAGATAVTESTVAGWGFTKNTGTVTSVKVGNTPYNPTNGVVSLPAYTFGTAGSDYVPITIGNTTKNVLTAHQSVTLASGTNNGTLKLTTAAGTVDNISVKGLGSIAYKATSDYLAYSTERASSTNAIDLNDYASSTDGEMKLLSWDNAGSQYAAHRPVTSSRAASLYVLPNRWGGMQLYVDYNTATYYLRNKYNNWTSWVELYHSGNLDSAKIQTIIGSGIYHPYGGDNGSGVKTFKIGGATLTYNPQSGSTPAYLEIDCALITKGDQIVVSGTPGGGGSGGSSTLEGLNDVSLSSLANGQYLVYDTSVSGGKWVNKQLDLSTYATQNYVMSAISALNLGAAATYGIGSVAQNNGGLVTGGAVWAAIDDLPEPMIFKGSLGTDGTITSLPAAAAANTGFTYKVITAGTYRNIAAKVGDTFISTGSSWVLIPSGDEPEGTVTSVGISLPTGLTLGSGSTNPITSSGSFKIAFESGYSIPLTADTAKGVSAYNSLGNYVLKAGDTMTGDLTIQKSGGGTLYIRNDTANGPGGDIIFRSRSNDVNGVRIAGVRSSSQYTFDRLDLVFYVSSQESQTYTWEEAMRIAKTKDVSTTASLSVGTTLSVNGLSTLTGGATIPSTASLKIGNATITWNTNGYLHIDKPLVTAGDQIVISGTPGGGGSGGSSTLEGLNDVSLSSLANGQYLVYDTSVSGGKWVNKALALASASVPGLMSSSDYSKLAGIAANANNYTLPAATSGALGGIQIGYSESGTNYAVKLSSNKAYVSVPWSDTKNTAGADNTTSKIFLVGPTAQTTSNGTARTYSNANCYASGGYLYSGGSKVLTGNETITLSGDVSGSGTTSISVTIGSGKVTNAMLAGSIAWSKLSVTAQNLYDLIGTTKYAPYNSAGYLPLSGGTLTGELVFSHSVTNGAGIKYTNTRATTSANNWGDVVLNIVDADGTEMSRIGIYGNKNNLSYLFIGSNGATGDNLRISSTGLTWGSSSIWHSGNSNLSTVDWAANELTVAGNIYLPNAGYLYGKNSSGIDLRMMYVSSSNNLIIGYDFATAGTTYIYGNTVSFRAGGSTSIVNIESTGINPHTTDTSTLGTSSLRWSNIYGNDMELIKAGGNASITLRGISTSNAGGGSIYFYSRTSKYNGFRISSLGTSYDRQSLAFYISDQASTTTATWTQAMRIHYDGKVKIGTGSPNEALDVTGSILSSGDQVVSSDITKKTNLVPIDLKVEQIAAAPAVTFDWKAGGRSFGSIAQYWKDVLGEAVLGTEGNYALAYGQLALVNTILIARQTENHEERIARLEKENAELRKEVERLRMN